MICASPSRWFALVLLLLGGCSSSAPSADSGVDVSVDASPQDSQADVVSDGVSPDTGHDGAASDIGVDAPGDQGADTGDSMVDIRVDLRRDTLPTDTMAADTRPADICRINACGGCTTLAAKPGDPCGLCGVWRCDGANKVGCNHRVNKITFLAPVGVPAVNTPADEVAPTLVPDARILYFERGAELWVAGRQFWQGPYQVVNPVSHGSTPITGFRQFTVRGDQRGLYATHKTTGLIYHFKKNYGLADAATILKISALQGGLNLTAPHASPDIDDRANYYDWLYYSSTSAGGAGGLDLYVAEQVPGSTPRPFGPGTPITGLNSAADDDGPSITADGLTLVFASTRTGGAGAADLYFSVRASRAHAWGAPIAVPGVNSSYNEKEPAMVLDNKTLYFQSDRVGGQGGWDIWKSQLQCL